VIDVHSVPDKKPSFPYTFHHPPGGIQSLRHLRHRKSGHVYTQQEEGEIPRHCDAAGKGLQYGEKQKLPKRPQEE